MEKQDREAYISNGKMYNDNITAIRQYNLRFFKLFNLLTILFMIGLFVSTFISDYAWSLRWVYVGYIIMLAVDELFVYCVHHKDDQWIMPLCYLGIAQIYVFCIISGVFFNQDSVAINFFAFMILLPLSVILRFRSLWTVQTISLTAFGICTCLVKSPEQAAEDMLCAAAYYIIGLVVTNQLNKMRIRYFWLNHKHDESEKENTALLNATPAGIMKLKITGTEITVLYANEPLIEMLGYTPGEFYARKVWTICDVAHPEDRNLLSKSVQNPEVGRTDTYEFRLKHKGTGNYRWVACKSMISEVSHDSIILLSDLLDIDTQKQAENASKAKSEFLSRMSHDIRTPLNGIIGLTELAIQENRDPCIQTDLETIAASGRYLLSLINDILDISRIESGKMELNPVPTSVAEFDHMIDSVIRPLADEKHITFDYEMNCGLPCARIDLIRFNQIFFNLLSNAVKFTPEYGHIIFSAVALSSDESTEWVRFSVKDNGIGMSPGFLEKAFDAFEQEQEHGYGSCQQQGTGLGLAIVRELVSLMGGTISVDSIPEKGTNVIVDLPLEKCAMPGEKQEVHPQKENLLEGKHILLVEDNEINQLVAIRLLEAKGVLVTVASNGLEALKLYGQSSEGSIHLILMDIRMPVMDGLTAARQIRAMDRPDAKTVPIIAMSANAYEEDRRLSLEAGMNAHLSKPVEPDMMYEAIKKYI